MFSLDHYDFGTPASEATELVTLEVDGQTVTVPAGTSVMRAAAIARTQIPKLCATDTLKAFGSCRLCLVEIEGRKGYPASCTTEVAPGMKVRTQSETLARLRRGVMELYLSDHPAELVSDQRPVRTEIREMAQRVGCTREPLWHRWRSPRRRGRRRQQSLFPVRSQCLHRVLALRARVR